MSAKKVLILCLHRPGRSPSQRFRFEQYLNFLEQHNYSFTFSYLLNEKADKIFYKPGHAFKKSLIVAKSTVKRIKEVITAKKFDLVFVQREAFMLGSSIFEKMIGKSIPLIFDFDDSIWMQNISDANKKLSFLKDANKTKHIIKAAKLVFAGNQYLAEYAKPFNNNIKVVPTTIDTDIYKRKINVGNDTVCIGWSGSFSTIQHFATAIPALKRIKEHYASKVTFKIIGDGNYYCQELDVKGEPWVSETEVEELSKIEIGIMPLPDDEWAKGKCGLKGLQYMALSIPTLMSPVGVNTEIIQHGENGYLPLSEDDWVKYLSELIQNKELRKRIGDAGRVTVIEKYSVEAWKEKYLEYFDELIAQSKS
jgi:glycosyltransferase involved in cell wall biosynthesis